MFDSLRNLCSFSTAWMPVLAVTVAVFNSELAIISHAQGPSVGPVASAPEDVVEIAERYLLSRDYDALEALIQRLRDQPAYDRDGALYLSIVYDRLSTPMTPPDRTRRSVLQDRRMHLEAWAGKSDSPAAYTAMANCLRSLAFEARGSGFTGTITPDGARAMDQAGAESQRAIDRARTLAGRSGVSDPLIAVVGLRIGLLEGYSREQMDDLLWEALEIEPRYRAPLYAMVNYLQPRWYGSEQKQRDLADQVARRTQAHLGQAGYALVAINVFAVENSVNLEADGFSWERIRQGMYDYLEMHPDSVWGMSHLLRLAHYAGDRATGRDMIERLEGRWTEGVYSAAVLDRSTRWAFDNDELGDAVMIKELGPVTSTQIGLLQGGRGWTLPLADRFFSVYATTTGQRTAHLDLWPQQLLAISDQANSEPIVYCVRESRELIVYRRQRNQAAERIGTLDAAPSRLTSNAAGNVIAAIDRNGHGKVWRIDDAPVPYPLPIQNQRQSHRSLALSPDGELAATGNFGMLEIWNTSTGEKVRQVDLPELIAINDLAWSHDGKLLVGTGEPAAVIAWETDDFTQLWRQDFEYTAFSTIAISSDQPRVAVGSWESRSQAPGEIVVLDAASGSPIQTLRGHRMPLFDLAITPDSKHIVSVSNDGSVRVWNLSPL